MRSGASGTAFEQGVALLTEGVASDALAKFRQAFDGATSDQQRADNLYNMALCYLRLGDRNAALAAIRETVTLDPKLKRDFADDEDFAELHPNAEFRAIVQESLSSTIPRSEPSFLSRTLNEFLWKKLIPGALLLVTAAIAPAAGFSQLVTLGIVIGALVMTLVLVSPTQKGQRIGVLERINDALIAGVTAGVGFVVLCIVLILALVLAAIAGGFG